MRGEQREEKLLSELRRGRRAVPEEGHKSREMRRDRTRQETRLAKPRRGEERREEEGRGAEKRGEEGREKQGERREKMEDRKEK